MSKPRAIDCQGFAGGFTLGTVQAGFELVGKREMLGGFGVANCEANRHLLGDGWFSQAVDPSEWIPMDVEYVFGNPPCSGFSLLSAKDFRGPDSKINDCMWQFAEFTARCRPYMAVFESVQQAFSLGGDLMRALRDYVESRTNERWHLYHVKHNAYSLGGAAIRRRYFWTISRIPFGIDPPELPSRLPDLLDVIGDLQGMSNTWEAQPYRHPPTFWSKSRRSDSGVTDGHYWRRVPALVRAFDLLPDAGPWVYREPISVVARRYYKMHGRLPDSWNNADRVIEKDFAMGFNQITRWKGDGPARVVTGGSIGLALHPKEDRTFTHREAARIQGFPDDWKIRPLRKVGGLTATWGKGIPCDAGRWISARVKDALEGNPGQYQGEPMGDRETLIDYTDAHRKIRNVS